MEKAWTRLNKVVISISISALGKGEADSSILSGSTIRTLGLRAFPVESPPNHPAAFGRTEREHTRGVRGKSVDGVLILFTEGRRRQTMRIWFDTEFYENGKTINLISIGMVREDGETYYAETPDCWLICHQDPWLVANVQPLLGAADAPRKHREEIAADIIAFAGEKPEFWAYYADYDWVALCQLYGRMMDLPKGWPMYCRDLKQWCDFVGNPALPKQDGTEHNALADARWNRDAFDFLAALAPPHSPTS